MNENLLIDLEARQIVTATFRRLDPVKRETIYTAALKAFAENVFDRVSLDTIAAASGISRGSIFQYFENKENLLKFVSALFLDNYRTYWDDHFAREHAVRTRERITAYLRARRDLYDSDRTGFNFLLKMRYENPAAVVAPFREELRQLQKALVASIVMRGIETGELRRDIDPDTIVLMILAAADHLEQSYAMTASSPKVKIDFRELTSKIVALLLEGLAG